MKTIRPTSLIIAVTIIAFALEARAGETPAPPPSSQDTWYGYQSLFNNTTGAGNSGFGYQALYSNTTGALNVGSGRWALFNNTTGNQNTAIGASALKLNTIGNNNTATGRLALSSNDSGNQNMADGWTALAANVNGSRNTASGGSALSSNTTGSDNTADGQFSLNSNTTGNNNIAVGEGAGSNLDTGDNNIEIGNQGNSGEANTIRLGDPTVHTAAFVAGIFGSSTATPGMPVYVDSNGKLGTLPSSERFKEDIRPMNAASDEIFSLKPVTFHYKPEVMKEAAAQFGLVAEDVAKVDCDLVVRDAKGKIQSVRYEAVNAMLLNEFIKEHRQVQEQQKEIDKLTAQLKEQASMLQKVSAQVELIKTAPRTVADTR
jgi:hypothetical protein